MSEDDPRQAAPSEQRCCGNCEQLAFWIADNAPMTLDEVISFC
jgi:hypothetical protein